MDICDKEHTEFPSHAVLDCRSHLLLLQLTLFLIQEPSIVPLDGLRARMLRSKRSCIDSQRALQERLRLGVLALRQIEHGQAVQAGGYVGMSMPQLLLADGQRSLVERLHFRVLPLSLVERG